MPLTHGQQIDECAKRIWSLNSQLENAFQMRNTFRRNDSLDAKTRRLIVVIVRDLRLYRGRMKRICQGTDYSETLELKFIPPHVSHY